MDADPCSTDTNASYVVHFHGHLNLTSENSQNRCQSGYSAGWNSTCAQALENTHIDHSNIGGCPGFTDKQIQEIQTHDPVTKQTPQEKAECNALNAKDRADLIASGGKVKANGTIVLSFPGGGRIIEPKNVPCA
jgi:chitinase